jgi:hypothetical protein
MSKHTAKPPLPQPYCETCHGLGWFKAYDYKKNSEEQDVYPCPWCNPLAPMGRRDKIIILIILALSLGMLFVAWVKS